MRGWVVVLGLFLWPSLAMAQDIPAGFHGMQFIDASGCVYSRSGGGWSPHLDRDGEHICGFPPTRIDSSAAQTVQESAQERLQTMLADGLRDGDLTNDRNEAQKRRMPLPHPGQAALQERVIRQVAVIEAVKTAVAAASSRSSDLCSQLGYVPTAQAAPIIGADVTQGLCPGMRAPLPEERLFTSPVRPTGDTADDRPVPAVAGPAARPPARPERTGKTVPDRPGQSRAPSIVKRSSQPTATREPDGPAPERIPANARFVEIGSFADDQNATIAIRKLSQLGYRVAQTHIRKDYQQKRVIMAGPFADRQALIIALNHLRANGFSAAIAR